MATEISDSDQREADGSSAEKQDETEAEDLKKQNKQQTTLFKTITQITEENVGTFGPFQVYVGFFSLYAMAAMATGIYASVFSDYTPRHHCVDNITRFAYSSEFYESADRCTADGELCQEFAYDKEIISSSASQEFDIVCSQAYLKSISGVLRMSGLLIGSFVFGWISDTFGRVNALTLGGILLTIIQVLTVFSWNYWMFSLLNLGAAASGIGMYLVAYVFVFEWSSPSWRTNVCILAQIPFSIGFLYLTLIAYFIRDWRDFQLFIAIPNLLHFVFKYLLPESPRWLASRGRVEEARDSMAFAAKMNKRSVPENIQISETGCEKTIDEDINIWTLVKEKEMLKRLVILSLNWIVITLSFYGLSLSSARDENLFVNVASMAAVEMPAYILCVLIIKLCGRRTLLIFCQCLGGLSCISAGLVPTSLPLLKMGLSLLGKLGSSSAFSIIYVYTAEQFPTKLRNSAMGLCSTLARVGAMVAPLITELEDIYLPLPLLLMGGSAVLAGMLVILLPETKGKPLPQTLQEAIDIRHATCNSS